MLVPHVFAGSPRSLRRMMGLAAIAFVLAGFGTAWAPLAARADEPLVKSEGDAPGPRATGRRPVTAFPTLGQVTTARLAASDTSVLHRFPADGPRLRFEGEDVTRAYPVFLSGAQANAHARVHLTYTNAVSVMPEASHMTVSVNDVVVAESAILSSAANGPVVLDAEIPEAILQPGYNAVKVKVQQRHRVDCSIGATYELWTQLDPASTGLTFPGVPQETISDIADLSALSPGPDGSRSLRLVVPKGTDGIGLERLLRALEAVVIRGNFGYADVDVASAPLEEPGLDLVVGTGSELRQAGLGNLLTDDQAIAFRPGALSGHSTLVITGDSPADIETAIGDIVRGTSTEAPPGTVAGLRALTLFGKPIRGETTISFRDLGVATQEFAGRMFRTSFDILMPPDFYAADYGKMTLRIDAGYAAGLDPGSQILVRVNDRDAASLALRNPKGDIFRKHPITVSLANLRPGFNHVQIEAQLANPSDKTCDVAGVIDAHNRFVLLEESTLEMPNVARIAHMPSLSATAASGFPYVSPDADTRLYIPHPDSDTVAAAAAFLVRAARAAGSPLAVKIVLSKPAMDDHSGIILGALGDLPSTMVQQVGIDPSRTRDVWSNIEAKSEAEVRLRKAQEKVGLRTPDRPDLPSDISDSRAESEVFQKWSANVTSDQWHFDPVGWVGNALGSGIGLTAQSLTPWGRDETSYIPDQRSRFLVAQHAAPGGNGATWTLLTAPTAELLARGMRTITSSTMWNQLDGRIATLDPQSTVLTTVPVVQGYFIKTAPLSPTNIRLIAAGWLSSYLEYYVLALVTLSLCLGLSTTAVVRRYGVKE